MNCEILPNPGLIPRYWKKSIKTIMITIKSLKVIYDWRVRGDIPSYHHFFQINAVITTAVSNIRNEIRYASITPLSNVSASS
jgi:hypothetical protein